MRDTQREKERERQFSWLFRCSLYSRLFHILVHSGEMKINKEKKEIILK